ncbi:hypothetical protein [Formosa sp. A9]|uniref:hypothetical protein n=1 Tax=Formosa sp. A9 TaxID=3442641 RepID=UPI003EBB794F
MKPLTVDFIKAQGFEKVETLPEEEFYYEDYTCSRLEYALTIFFNYFKTGEVSYDVDLDGYELENVGEDELLTLIKVLPKKQ